MLIAAKILGATCLAGALAATGVLTTDSFTSHDPVGPAAGITLSDPHATFQALAVGGQAEVPAGDAGSVTVQRTASGLEVAAVAPAAGWTSLTKKIAPDWIIVTFENGNQQADLSLDIVNDSLRIRQADSAVDASTTTTTTTEAPTTTTTEAPSTTTTTAVPVPTTPPPAPTPVTLPPPTQPTVIPVAGAGTVVIVLQGPVVVVSSVNALPGWVASVEGRAGDVDVLFRRGDRSFRFFASMVGRHMTSAVREVRADGEHPVSADDGRGGPGGDGHRGRH